MRREKILAAIGGLAILAGALAAVLSESPPRVLAAGPPSTQPFAAARNGSLAACQENERLVGGTTALRLSLSAFVGPHVTVKVLSDGHLLAAGDHSSGWSGHDVTVALRTIPRSVSKATICYATSRGPHQLVLYGRLTGAGQAARAPNGVALTGRVSIEDLGNGNKSWLSLATSIARHMGLGRAWSGTWVAFLVAMLTLAACAVACFVYLHEPDE